MVDAFEPVMEQRKEFFVAVGQGITFWAGMESILIEIAAKLLTTTDEKAGLVLYSINSFYTWISIIDELLKIESYEHLLSLWREQMEALKKENDIRVRLAHHMISQEVTHLGGGLTRTQAYLKPAELDIRSKSKSHRLEPLTINEIRDFTLRVITIHDKLNLLLNEIDKRAASH